MKLFTEEQVYLMLFHAADIYEGYMLYEDVLKTQTPIQLPSDEEVDNASLMISSERMEFIKGANWLKSQILKQIESC